MFFTSMDQSFLQQEREKFETVLLRVKPHLSKHLELEQFGTFKGEYLNQEVQTAFVVWLERAGFKPFQDKAHHWCVQCLGVNSSNNKLERAARFIEEALELVQVCGLNGSDVKKIAYNVYSKKTGEVDKEIGDVMVTLAILSSAYDVSMETRAKVQLGTLTGKIAEIRKRDAAKKEKLKLSFEVKDNGQS